MEHLNPHLALKLDMCMHRSFLGSDAMEHGKKFEPHAHVRLGMLHNVELHSLGTQEVSDIVEDMIALLLAQQGGIWIGLAVRWRRRWQYERRDARVMVVREERLENVQLHDKHAALYHELRGNTRYTKELHSHVVHGVLRLTVVQDERLDQARIHDGKLQGDLALRLTTRQQVENKVAHLKSSAFPHFGIEKQQRIEHAKMRRVKKIAAHRCRGLGPLGHMPWAHECGCDECLDRAAVGRRARCVVQGRACQFSDERQYTSSHFFDEIVKCMLYCNEQIDHTDTPCHDNESTHVLRHRHDLSALPIDHFSKVPRIFGRQGRADLENFVRHLIETVFLVIPEQGDKQRW